MEKDILMLLEMTALSAEQTERAIKRALERSARRFRMGLIKTASRSVGVPQKLLKQRVYLRRGSEPLSKIISILAYGIPAARIPGVRQNRHGVMIPRRGQIQGAFLARSRFGRLPQRVFRRLGRERLPIKEQTIPVRDDILGAISQNENRVREGFLKDLMHEIRYRGGLIK